MPKRNSNRTQALLPRSRVMVAVANRIDHELLCARKYGLGAEIQTFGFPEYLARDNGPLLKRIGRAVGALEGPIGCHGPFIDTIHYSTDPDVREVARLRYLRAFDIAEALGAKYVLFHSQFNPIIRVPAYKRIYHEESLRFWPELIEEAENRRLPIYIENMFDDSPAPVAKLAESFNSPYFSICLDVAHAVIHSTLDMAEWVDAYRPYLRHVHLNDCHGTMDDHLGLGQGVLDLSGIIALLKKTRIPLTYALETGIHTAASLKFLGIPRVE